MAFIDMGDQFIALSEGRTQPPDRARHFGLVVDDKEAVRAALEDAGAEILAGRGLDFRDPWGNHVQVVSGDIQFTKAPEVLGGMGLELEGRASRAARQGARLSTRASVLERNADQIQPPRERSEAELGERASSTPSASQASLGGETDSATAGSRSVIRRCTTSPRAASSLTASRRNQVPYAM